MKRKRVVLKENTELGEQKPSSARKLCKIEPSSANGGSVPTSSEGFNELDLVSKFDQILSLSLNRNFLVSSCPLSKTKKKKFPYLTSLHLFIDQIYATLQRGWENRTSSFSFFWIKNDEKPQFLPDESGLCDEETILIGLRLLPDWKNPITRGPQANLTEAKEFRQFYGEKSELRKFVDNAICEAVVWIGEGEIDEEHLQMVPYFIMRHLLTLHFKVLKSNLRLVTSFPTGLSTPILSFKRITQAYDKLAQTLRLLKDLPLTVVNVQCLSGYYRKTEPFPPPISTPEKDKNCTLDGDILKLRQNYHSQVVYNPSIGVLVSLEQTARWGDNLHVIAKLKTAFYMEMAKALKAKNFTAFPLESRLMVVLDSVVFSIQIFQAREVAIIKKHEEAGNTAQISKSMGSKTMEKRFIHSPHMLLLLQSLSQRFVAFGESCQLARSWLSAHFLGDAFDDIALELLMAKVFLEEDVEENYAPMTPFAGFVRFLHLLSNHSWVRDPILIDANNVWGEDKRRDIVKQFQKMRPVLPPVTIITPEDEIGSRYTRARPEAVIMKRIIALANVALASITDHVMRSQQPDFETLFHGDTSIYDIVIHVLHFQVARNPENLKPLPEESKSKASILPLFDYDPVEKLVKELRNSYDSVALFFYNKYGGSAIGVLLRPSFKQSRPVRISNGQIQAKEGTELKTNLQALVDDFRVIGKRLIQEISISPGLAV